MSSSINAKHRKTLSAIYTDPLPKQLSWRDIESLLVAVGAKAVEGRGSRVSFNKGDEIISFHRPHPEKEAKPYQVKNAREFLTKIGVEP